MYLSILNFPTCLIVDQQPMVCRPAPVKEPTQELFPEQSPHTCETLTSSSTEGPGRKMDPSSHSQGIPHHLPRTVTCFIHSFIDSHMHSVNENYHRRKVKNTQREISLAVQWLGLLPMQEVWVRSVVGELRSHMPPGQKT